jgi:hypothetical protein
MDRRRIRRYGDQGPGEVMKTREITFLNGHKHVAEEQSTRTLCGLRIHDHCSDVPGLPYRVECCHRCRRIIEEAWCEEAS